MKKRLFHASILSIILVFILSTISVGAAPQANKVSTPQAQTPPELAEIFGDLDTTSSKEIGRASCRERV